MENTQTNKSLMGSTDQKWKGLYAFSGIFIILTAVLSLVVAYNARILYSTGYPADPAAYLQLVAQHQQLANVTWSLWIVIDFLGVAPAIAIYLILRRYNHALALLGSLLALFYTIYDFGVTELNSLTLVSLGSQYAAATNPSVRASLLGAAAYGYYALPLQTVLSFAIGPIGYLLWCIPMAKSFFGRWMAIIGVIVNIIGIVGAAAPVVPSSFFLGLCQFLCVRLIAIWSFILGVQLLIHVYRVPKGQDYHTILSGSAI